MMSEQFRNRANAATKQRRGAAIVELAVILPFLALLVLGMLEMAQAMKVKHALDEAARKGGRLAAMPNTGDATITQEVKNVLIVHGIDPAVVTVTIRVNDLKADALTSKRNDKISVRVSVPAKKVLLVSYFMDGGTITSELVMMRLG